MKTLTKKNKTGGYAILFAVVIVSIISLIAIGLSNSTYKQLVLSSLANDSQVAFYQADTATECALYADNVLGIFTSASNPPNPWFCGKNADGTADLSFTIVDNTPVFNVNSNSNGTSNPCFDFSVENLVPVNPSDPTKLIKSKGYNSCDKANPRTVEREIKTTY